jgi:ceramide glucosyltransferase
LWALVACGARQWWTGAGALIIRLVIGWLTGARILKDPNVTRWFWLMPVRDLFGLAVWVAGCFGSVVYWRGRKLRLAEEGRIRV